ncbi:uncharacterized protein IL334_004497 [Kwoniella shivajii]|uniref:Zn(2)-C6 fungal-type domain-containing protein n=1 Tax=Kwoniella shivajii TaxID=564305 RepID=A0ABZ1D0G4_9TREE|nr:hypothetical protein IL334_004497 [Kwoniella shivajii]
MQLDTHYDWPLKRVTEDAEAALQHAILITARPTILHCYLPIKLNAHLKMEPLSPTHRDTDSNAGPSGAPRRRIVRTRNGCLTCRKRRIKCDLGKPECARCVKYCAECSYPAKQKIQSLRFIQPAPSLPSTPRTVNTPQTSQIEELLHIPRATSCPHEEIASATLEQRVLLVPASDNDTSLVPIPPTHFATSPAAATPIGVIRNTSSLGWQATLEALGPVDRLLAVCRNTRMGSFFLQPCAPPDFLRSFFPSSDDLQCFHHCVTYSLSIIVVSEDRNPWIEEVAPLFMANETDGSGSEALKYAMLSLGAVHLSYLRGRDGDTAASNQTRSLALQYRTTTIRILRQNLRNCAKIHHPTFLSACFLTLTADLLSANARWREPFRMVKRSIDSAGGLSMLFLASASVNPALKCATEALVNLSVLASLSTGENYSMLVEDGDPEKIPPWWTQLEEAESRQSSLRPFEASCGISRSIISRFSSLLAMMPKSELWQHFDAPAADRIETDWYELITADNFERKDQRTQSGSLAIWQAGKILIFRKLRGLPREDPRVQDAAAGILTLCASVGDKIEYLNWPLIIACSTLIDPTKRNTARAQLKSFVPQCCYEIEVVQMICEEMWARIDDGEDDEACGWVEIMIEAGSPVLIG